MPNFKPKANKKFNIDKRSTITVDSKHQEYLKKFENDEKLLPKLEKQIVDLQDKINMYNKKKERQTIQFNEVQNINIQIDNTENAIEKIKKQIKQIKNNKLNYYIENSKYIFEYFESKQNMLTNTNKKHILNNFFKKREEKENVVQEQPSISASKKYFYNVDETYIDINDYYESYNVCKCNGEYIHVDNEGVLICNKCGVQTSYLIEHEKPSYKEPPKEVSYYAYKRINHFREILAQFQAKESTQICDTIIENIKKQIKKERLNIEQLTNDKTKQLLKNLGYNKYYEHIPFIKEKLGIKPLVMSVELENKLCNLFIEIQQPYSKFCPDDRMNFLNYYYVLYKLCELLGEDEYLEHCYMLKDPVKRIEQDEIWKKICDDLEWEFIPTP
jgi:hypothetical protein